MSTALGLAMQISANTAQLAQAVQDVNKRLDEMGGAGKKAAADLATLKNIEIGKIALGGVKAAAGAFIQLSASVVGAINDISSFALSVGKELDELSKVAQRTGVSVEALQAYGAAAQLAGMDIESFAKAIQKLSINIGAATIDEKAQKKFAELGLTFQELKDMDPTSQFEAIADAVAKIADESERNKVLVNIFGKGGIELGPLFSEGPGALKRMREEAEALGMVVDQESISAIERMNDAFDKVWFTIKGLTGQILGQLAEPIAQITEDLLKVVAEAGAVNIAQDIAGGLLDFIQMAGTAFLNLAKFIDAFVRKFSTILGIDLRSDAEKELAALKKKEDGTTQTVNMGGVGTTTVRYKGTLTPEEEKRKRELETQIQAEQNGTIYDLMRQSLNSAVGNARERLETAQAQREAGPVVAGPAAPSQQDGETAAVQQQQLDELRKLNRNNEPATVEILN